MPPHKAPPIKKPKFGGKPKVKELPPDKKTLESFGGARPKQKPFEPRVSAQQETGFIQATPKQATASMMGRAPPPLIAKSSTRKDSRKQFKPKGRKVF